MVGDSWGACCCCCCRVVSQKHFPSESWSEHTQLTQSVREGAGAPLMIDRARQRTAQKQRGEQRACRETVTAQRSVLPARLSAASAPPETDAHPLHLSRGPGPVSHPLRVTDTSTGLVLTQETIPTIFLHHTYQSTFPPQPPAASLVTTLCPPHVLHHTHTCRHSPRAGDGGGQRTDFSWAALASAM